MDLTFDDAQEELRTATRRFLDAQDPLQLIRDVLEADQTFDPLQWERGAELGWTSVLLPERDGGGGTIVDLLVVAEELGRVVYPGPLVGTQVLALALQRDGSESQRAELIPSLASGATTGAWCLYEPDGEWIGDAVNAKALQVGDGFALYGTKRFVQDASAVTHLLVTARLDGVLAQFVIPSSHPGVEHEQLRTLDLTRRFFEVRFTGARVDASALLGRPGLDTERTVELQRQLALVLLCADTVGGAERLLEMTVEYAGDRIQFGRPIASFQAIKHKCATMLTNLEAARACTYAAALEVAEETGGGAEAVAIAKATCGEFLSALASEALQTHGGIGFTWEHDLHLFLRRTRTNEMLFGTPAWHYDHIARLIGL